MFTVELNNVQKDSNHYANAKLNAKSPIVEIFSAAATGQDLSKFGAKANAAMTLHNGLSLFEHCLIQL